MSDRPNVLVTRPIMDAPLARLGERCDVEIHRNEFGIPREELLEVVEGRDAIVTMLTEKVDAELLAAAGPRLKVVANHAVGFDNIDVAACTAAGVLATNTPDVLTETTADTAFALLMTAARRVGEGERFLRAKTPWIWGPLMMLGQDVHHKTIGVVGFGRIGQAVARRAKGFGMRVIYADAVQLPPEVEAETGAERRTFPELLAESDFISIHTNLTPETRHLFGAEAFRTMKPTAVLVNTARGAVVQERALVDAVRDGEIAGAALDVVTEEPLPADDPLRGVDGIVVYSHMAGQTAQARAAAGLEGAAELVAALAGRPRYAVNAHLFAVPATTPEETA